MKLDDEKALELYLKDQGVNNIDDIEDYHTPYEVVEIISRILKEITDDE